MKVLNLALLSGGRSPERDVSIYGGDQVAEALDSKKYKVTRYDPKYDLAKLVADAPGIDMALIILHGPFGEDGTVQGLLDLLEIPYQGSGVLGSAIAMNKLISKQIYEKNGLPVPPYVFFTKGDSINLEKCEDTLGLPMVVKPVQGGSSIGMSIVKKTEDLSAAIEKAFACDDQVMIEAYIDGDELTCGVIGNDDLVALPIIQIVPEKSHDFFDYEAKYTPGSTKEICPAPIEPVFASQAQKLGKRAHQSLCCRDYSRTDMILAKGEIFILETNTIPGMTPASLLPLAAKEHGLSFAGLLDRLIELCMERHVAGL